MAKYLRYSIALKSKVYIEIVEQAELRLADHGTFSKVDVLDRAGYTAIAADLRWDYVRRMIEEKHRTELIPLAPSYYKRHRKEEELTFTEKFVAKGNGRGTVGYAIASEQNGHFVIHRLQLKTKMAKAFSDSAERTKIIGMRVGAIKPPQTEQPMIEDKKDEDEPKAMAS